MASDRRFYPILLSVLFILFAFLSVLVCRMIISGTVYSYSPIGFRQCTFADKVGLITDSLRSSAVQLLVLYFAGFSCFAMPVGFVITAYRGICFGYTVATFSKGDLLLTDNKSPLIPIIGVPRLFVVLMLYFAATVAISCMCYLAVRRSDSLLRNGDVSKSDRRYTLLFAVLSGAVFFCDFLKLTVL